MSYHETSADPGSTNPRGLRPSRLVLTVVLALLAGLAIGAVPPNRVLVVAGGLAALAIILSIVGIMGPKGTTLPIVCGAALLVSMNALRPSVALTYADVLLGLAIVPVLIQGMGQRIRAAQLAAYVPVLVLTATVVGGGLLGSFVATDQVASLGQLVRFTASSLLLLLLIAVWAPGRRSLHLVAWCYVLGIVVNAVWGIAVTDAGGRALGLSAHPNHLGLTACLGVGVALGLAFTIHDALKRAGVFACIAILVFAVILSGSRAAFLGTAVSVVLFLLATRQWKVVLWGGAAAGAVLLAINRNILELGEYNAIARLLGDASSAASDVGRRQYLEAGLQQISENPLSGSGFESALFAHSIYVQLWASAGILGLVFIFGLAFVVFWELLKARRRSDVLSVGLTCAYLGYLVAGIASSALWDRYLWLHLALIFGLAATYRESESTGEALPPTSTEPKAGRRQRIP